MRENSYCIFHEFLYTWKMRKNIYCFFAKQHGPKLAKINGLFFAYFTHMSLNNQHVTQCMFQVIDIMTKGHQLNPDQFVPGVWNVPVLCSWPHSAFASHSYFTSLPGRSYCSGNLSFQTHCCHHHCITTVHQIMQQMLFCYMHSFEGSWRTYVFTHMKMSFRYIIGIFTGIVITMMIILPALWS